MRYDLIVIGEDPAGLATAQLAAQRGLKSAVVFPVLDALESGPFLSEALREMVPELAADALRSPDVDWSSTHHMSIEALRALVIDRVDDVFTRQLISQRRSGVDVFVGTSQLLDDHSVEVAGEDIAQVFESKAIVIATGTASAPDRPIGLREFVTDSDCVLHANQLPRELVVVGAEPTSVEFAGLFAVAGSGVTVVNGKSGINPSDDAQLDVLLDVAMALGVNFRLSADVVGMDPVGVGKERGVDVQLDSGERLFANKVLQAGRREGRTQALNLPAAGLIADDCHRLWCDNQFRTWQPHVFGVGDVVGFAPKILSPQGQAEVVVAALSTDSTVPKPLGLIGRKNRERFRLFPK